MAPVNRLVFAPGLDLWLAAGDDARRTVSRTPFDREPEPHALEALLTACVPDPQERRMATNGPTPPDTIVLIHGLWMTPRSWENWVTRYEEAGYKVIAPAYPGLEVEVEALRLDPTPIEELTIEGT